MPTPGRYSLDPTEYLAGDAIVETDSPTVQALAAELRSRARTDEDYARLAFEWVRDQIAHSWDAQDLRVPLTATEVLEERVGLCYAKSHLLAALLRCEGIPCALGYQRLKDDSFGFMLHGIVAVYLRGGWHRQDPRGNKSGVNAQFSLEEEQLAFPVDPSLGEVDYPELFVSPANVVVEALRAASDASTLYAGGLPSELWPAATGPVALTGHLVCNDETELATVRDHLPIHIELTRAEPGCMSFEVTQTANPLIWQVDELFLNKEALADHQARVADSEWGRVTLGIQRRYVVDSEEPESTSDRA